MAQPKFEPDRIWTRSVTWKNHSTYIKSNEEETKKGIDITRRGYVIVPGFAIHVHAAEWKSQHGKGYRFTQLHTVRNGVKYMAYFKKCYSEQYCVTLAKRFAKKLSEGNDV